MENDYGLCPKCNSALEAETFIEEETKVSDGIFFKTGRKRVAIDVLICPCCGKRVAIDDSFDGPWF